MRVEEILREPLKLERSIVYTGKKQRSLITHYPGIEIRECLPWNAYEKRMEAING